MSISVRHFVYLLCTAFFLGSSLAQESASDPEVKLQTVIELFLEGSTEDGHIQLDENESAIVTFVRSTDDAEFYMLLGRAYFYAELDQKAMGMFTIALEREPSLSEAHFFIGLLQRYAGDLDGAQVSFSNAAETNIRESKYFVELARTFQLNNDDASAIAAYERALSLDPSNFDSNFNLATIYAVKGNVDEAELHFSEAVAQKPEDVDSHYNLGQLYQTENDHEKAIKYFERVVALKPDEWRAIGKLVQEYEAVNDPTKRDAAVDRIYRVWRSGTAPELMKQGFYVRDQMDVENGKLFALEYFELIGERPRKYVFNLQDPQSGEFVFSVSLGSYEATNKFAKATGDIATNERLYHLDGYSPNGSHYTYAFFVELPSYTVAKEFTLKALSGELKAASSTIVKD